MSCTSFDWKAYALGEMDVAGRTQAEAHAATCETCREEIAGIRLTLDALSTLNEEEMPRRIGFVSDKVFAPRWWSFILRPSFAAASLVAAAILAHGAMSVRASRSQAAASIDSAAIELRVEKQVNVRIQDAVNQAVAQSEQQQAEKVANVLAVAEKRFAEQRRADLQAAEENFDMVKKQYYTVWAANTGMSR